MKRNYTGCIYIENEEIAVIIMDIDVSISDNEAMDKAIQLIKSER